MGGYQSHGHTTLTPLTKDTPMEQSFIPESYDGSGDTQWMLG